MLLSASGSSGLGSSSIKSSGTSLGSKRAVAKPAIDPVADTAVGTPSTTTVGTMPSTTIIGGSLGSDTFIIQQPQTAISPTTNPVLITSGDNPFIFQQDNSFTSPLIIFNNDDEEEEEEETREVVVQQPPPPPPQPQPVQNGTNPFGGTATGGMFTGNPLEGLGLPLGNFVQQRGEFISGLTGQDFIPGGDPFEVLNNFANNGLGGFGNLGGFGGSDTAVDLAGLNPFNALDLVRDLF